MRENIIFYVLICFCILLSVAPLHGQRYDFKTYSVEDGVAQSVIFSICQSRNGYLWLGTNGGGLDRYDGVRFMNFSVKDGLSSNVVNSVIEDRKGCLWIGTGDGLNKFDGQTITVYNQKNGLGDDDIHRIKEARDGYLWLALKSGGVSRYDGAHFKNFTTVEGLIDNYVRSILPVSKGNVWIGTLKGLSLYDGARFIENPVTRYFTGIEIRDIYEDKKGNLWFATNKGVVRYDGKTFVSFKKAEGLIDDNVKSILEDRNGEYWFATSNGVSRYDGKEFTGFTTNEGLCYNDVEDIYEDHEGNLWFGTQGGMSKFRGEMFTYFGVNDGLKDDWVWSICQDSSGVIWMATDKGISKYYGKGRPIETETKGYAGAKPYPLYMDRDGNIWFGAGAGVAGEFKIIKTNGKEYIDVSKEMKISDFELFSITQDKKDVFWFGSRNKGVLLYDGYNVKRFTANDWLLGKNINTIIEDFKGNIWIGTDKGIIIYDRKTFKKITADNGLIHQNIMCMTEDSKNNLWIGAYGGGIILYSPGKGEPGKNSFVNFSSTDGLLDNDSLSMVFQDEDHLWIGTNTGISSLDVGEYWKTGSVVFKNFGKDEGFSGVECNQNASFRDRDGNLWFGTIKGVILYKPREDRFNRVEPVTHITGLKLFMKEMGKLPEKLELHYTQNHLTFEFIGISLTVPEKVKYSFKLEGADDKWSPVSNVTYYTYSNLEPGNYSFMVKACNNCGIWNREPVVYNFRIQTPFWKTWWFFALVVILGTGLVYAFTRLRVRNFEKRQRFLEKQIQIRTQELKEEKEKVEEINYELEKRVLERTRKLADANKQLLQAQKMEVIGTLAGGVAHDLNNVMVGLVSYPDLLLMKIPEDSPLRKYALTIKRSGEKATAIVQDLLTLARRGISISDVVNLNQVALDFLESPECEKILAYHTSTKVETQLYKDLPNMLGSPFHLSKAVMNLVSNAAEAMPEGGEILISTGVHFIDKPFNGYDEIEKGNYVYIAVSDNGIGIATEDLEHIYEPFYTKKKMGKSGTGLGMTVVWGTVQDHNGYIDLKSVEKKGTTFTLYFPSTHLQVNVEKINNSKIFNNLKGNGENILVVDDVEEQREAAALMLEELGYTVNTVSSGEEAVEYVKNHPVNLVVLDMEMDPGISGCATYKEILGISPGLKAVIISGYSETRESKLTQEMGAGAFIKKPFDIVTIGKAVKQELKKN